MAIITLTSDMGTKDHYVAAVKGAIYSELENAAIVDVTHELPPFEIAQAWFVVRNAYRNFPKGTIHIIGIKPEAVLPTNKGGHDETVHIAAEYDGHFFIGADNGLFSLIFEHTPDNLVELNFPLDSDDLNFPTKHVFAKAACHLARGGTLEVIGKKMDALKERAIFRPVIDNEVIKGTVIYVDNYGNIITNITKEVFKDGVKGRAFEIGIPDSTHSISEISQTYNDVVGGEILALFNATGFLEIALNQGNASGLLGLKLNDIIRIEIIP